MKNYKTLDVIIIGGSYAGLSAGMSLGRAIRNVLIIDAGNPCNQQTPHSHNFITHDGERPGDISDKAKRELLKYKTVKFQKGKVVSATKNETGFRVKIEDGDTFSARKLIFATGLTDIMPGINGFVDCWGISILHCPYCHGYEFKGENTGVLGNGDLGFDFTKVIYNWTKKLTLFTSGKSTLTNEQIAKFKSHNIPVVETEIENIDHNDGFIKKITCNNGDTYTIKALYTKPQYKQRCALAEELGCEMTEQGLIKVDMFQRTTVYGVFAAGDNAMPGRAVSLATATGAVAGMFSNKELIEEEF